MPEFSRIFCAVHLRVIYKKHFFWPTVTYSGLCSSAHTCSKYVMLVRVLGRVHIFILVQVWGQYLSSTLSYSFLKNMPLLVCSSWAKHTEKQDLLFLKIVLTRRRDELEGREWYRWKGFFMLYKLSITSFLSLYKWKCQNTHPHLVVNLCSPWSSIFHVFGVRLVTVYRFEISGDCLSPVFAGSASRSVGAEPSC